MDANPSIKRTWIAALLLVFLCSCSLAPTAAAPAPASATPVPTLAPTTPAPTLVATATQAGPPLAATATQAGPPLAATATQAGPPLAATATQAGLPLAAATPLEISPSVQLGKGTATAMALSPDGRWLAMIKPFGVYGYDTSTQKQVWFKTFADDPTSLAFSPDSQQLAVGTTGSVLSVLAAPTGQVALKIEGQPLMRADWSPDGTKLLSSANCQEVKVWDAATGGLLHAVQEASCNSVTSGLVNAVWSFDGRRIYIVQDSGMISAWDAASGQPLANFQPPASQSVFSSDLYPSPAQNVLAVENGLSVVLLDGETGKIVQTLSDPRLIVQPSYILWSPDGKQLSADAGEGHVTWDVDTARAVEFLPDYGEIAAMVWSPADQPTAGIFMKDGNFNPVGLATGSLLVGQDEFNPASTAPISMKWNSPEVLTYDGTDILRWELSSGRLLGRTPAPPPADWPAPSGGGDPFVSLDGTRRLDMPSETTPPLADGTTMEYYNLAVVDIKSGQELARLKDQPKHGRDIVAWSPNGTRIVAGDSLWIDSTIVWDAATGRILFTLPNEFGAKRAAVDTFAWSPDGARIAAGEFLLGPVGESIGMLVVWDAASGVQGSVLKDGLADERIAPLAWSPDGKWLAGGGSGGKTFLWDMTHDRLAAILEGHAAAVSGFLWSADSRSLASNAADGTIMIWQRP